MKTIRSFGYAWQGLKHAFATQTNFKIHLLLAALAISFGIGLHISMMEWMIVAICCGMMPFAELVNTALEKLADVVQKDHHPGIKLAKDISAAAVLMLAITSAVAGTLVFLPKIINIIKSM